MTSEADSVKAEIAELLKELFDIRRKRNKLENEYKAKTTKRKEKFEEKDSPLATRQAEIMEELRTLVSSNKSKLLTGAIKSFAMIYGKVSFAKKRETFKIKDKDKIEELARRDRILTKVGGFKREWKADAKLLSAWLKANPDKAAEYEQFIERDGGYEEILAKPNDTYLTKFDPNRLSEEAVNLGPEIVEDKDTNAPTV